MSSQTDVLSERDASSRLLALNAKERNISNEIIRMKAELSAVERELAKARSDAKERFGTDDLDELRLLYRQSLESNSAKIMGYSEGLDDAQKLVDHMNESLRQLEDNK